MAKIIGDSIPNIPWQDKPEGYRYPVWRYDANPIITRDNLYMANSIFNSAVVPYGDGFAGVFRELSTSLGLVDKRMLLTGSLKRRLYSEVTTPDSALSTASIIFHGLTSHLTAQQSVSLTQPISRSGLSWRMPATPLQETAYFSPER